MTSVYCSYPFLFADDVSNLKPYCILCMAKLKQSNKFISFWSYLGFIASSILRFYYSLIFTDNHEGKDEEGSKYKRAIRVWWMALQMTMPNSRPVTKPARIILNASQNSILLKIKAMCIWLFWISLFLLVFTARDQQMCAACSARDRRTCRNMYVICMYVYNILRAISV